MPPRSWHLYSLLGYSLPGSAFTWVDLAPFPAFPHSLNAQHLELGCLLIGHHMGLQCHNFSNHQTSGSSLGYLQGFSGCLTPRHVL